MMLKSVEIRDCVISDETHLEIADSICFPHIICNMVVQGALVDYQFSVSGRWSISYLIIYSKAVNGITIQPNLFVPEK